jgi:hypothetical protein
VCPILFPNKQVLACPATQRKGPTIRITLACDAHRVAGTKEASGGAVLIRDWRRTKPRSQDFQLGGTRQQIMARSGDSKETKSLPCAPMSGFLVAPRAKEDTNCLAHIKAEAQSAGTVPEAICQTALDMRVGVWKRQQPGNQVFSLDGSGLATCECKSLLVVTLVNLS